MYGGRKVLGLRFSLLRSTVVCELAQVIKLAHKEGHTLTLAYHTGSAQCIGKLYKGIYLPNNQFGLGTVHILHKAEL